MPSTPGTAATRTLRARRARRNGTAPSAACSTRTSSSQSARNPATSNKYDAVGANTCRSPVQPSRSSRCGQSVGTSTKLPRIPHTTFSCSRLTSSCRARERAGALEVRMDHDRSEVRRVGIDRRPPVDLDVPESVERERRLPRLGVAAPQDVPVGGTSVAQRADTELTALEDLGVTKRQHGAGLPLHREPHPAHQVLTEVQHGPPRRCDDHVLHGQFSRPPHGWTLPRNESADCRFEPLDGIPRPIVEPGPRPAVHVEPGVVRLTVVQVSIDHRTARRPPRRVRGNRVDRSVGPGDLQLCEEAEAVAVDVAGHLPGEMTPPPAIGDHRTDHVLAGNDLFGDVVGLVPEALLVCGPARSEHGVADDGTVEMQLIDPGRGGVEASPHNGGAVRCGDSERVAEVDRRVQLTVGFTCGRSDPRRRPIVSREQPGLHVEWFAPCRRGTVTAPHADPHPMGGARRQRLAGPRNQHGLVVGDAPEWRPVELDLVRGLQPTRDLRDRDPRQPRHGLTDADHATAQMLYM